MSLSKPGHFWLTRRESGDSLWTFLRRPYFLKCSRCGLRIEFRRPPAAHRRHTSLLARVLHPHRDFYFIAPGRRALLVRDEPDPPCETAQPRP